MKPTPIVAKALENVYEPSEDSFFLLDCLEKDEKFIQAFVQNLPSSALIAELGTGTGIISSFVPQILDTKYLDLAADVSPAACQCARDTWALNWPNKGPLEVVRGNLFDFMRPNLIDVLVFNPPYVPSPTIPNLPRHSSEQEELIDDKWVDLALDGGADGMEITNVVLSNLDHYLSGNGIAYILFCASNHPKEVCEKMKHHGWSSAHIDTRRAGWEILSVYRFTRERSLAEE